MASSTSSGATFGLALVGARLGRQGRHAVLVVAHQPGLDRAPGEPAGVAVLVGEGHLADRLDAFALAVALGHVDGAEHAHLQVRGWIAHRWICLLLV